MKNKTNIKNKRIKLKWRNIITTLILIISTSLLIYSSFNIIIWYKDNKKTDKQINNIIENTEVNEINDNENTEIIAEEIEDEEIIPNQNNDYFSYLNMNLIDVDFEELKLINNDVKGWIQVDGTNINYPFVQAKDNKYYLTHSFDKSYNQAGWVFLDYRNNINDLDKNTILYAHGRVDNTMFGSLRTIFNNNWYKNTKQYVIKISTEKENSLWQVFSVYKIKTTSDYIKTTFTTDQEFLNFLEMLKERSQYKFNTNLKTSDKIITLSTCYNKTQKAVMHAKLIKKEVK